MLHRYPPVGKCIYCGSTDRLGDEHIIASGLEGAWVLPQASCRRCEGSTSAIEGACLRGILHGARMHLNLGKRRKKAKPSRLWATVKQNGSDLSHSFPVADYPALLMLPILSTPAILDVEGATGGIIGMWMRNLNMKWPQLHQKNITNLYMDLDSYRFAQMLAKIAHAHAVAVLGLDGFSPLLLDLIKKPPSVPFHLVGGTRLLMPSVNQLHTLERSNVVRNNTRYLIVSIRLFARFGGPHYQVVTGALDPTTHAVSIKNFFHTLAIKFFLIEREPVPVWVVCGV